MQPQKLIDGRTKTSNLSLSEKAQISMGISTECQAGLNEDGLMVVQQHHWLRVSRRNFERGASARIRGIERKARKEEC